MVDPRQAEMTDAEIALMGWDVGSRRDPASMSLDDHLFHWGWFHAPVSAAVVMLHVELIVARVVRARLWRRRVDPPADYAARAEEATREVTLRVIERLRALARDYDEIRGDGAAYIACLAHGYLRHWLREERRWERRDGVDGDGRVVASASDEDDDSARACPMALRSREMDPSLAAELGIVIDEVVDVLVGMGPEVAKAFGVVGLGGASVRAAAGQIGVHYSQVARRARAGADAVRARLARRVGAEAMADMSQHVPAIAEACRRRVKVGAGEVR